MGSQDTAEHQSVCLVFSSFPHFPLFCPIFSPSSSLSFIPSMVTQLVSRTLGYRSSIQKYEWKSLCSLSGSHWETKTFPPWPLAKHPSSVSISGLSSALAINPQRCSEPVGGCWDDACEPRMPQDSGPGGEHDCFISSMGRQTQRPLLLLDGLIFRSHDRNKVWDGGNKKKWKGT